MFLTCPLFLLIISTKDRTEAHLSSQISYLNSYIFSRREEHQQYGPSRYPRITTHPKKLNRPDLPILPHLSGVIWKIAQSERQDEYN